MPDDKGKDISRAMHKILKVEEDITYLAKKDPELWKSVIKLDQAWSLIYKYKNN